MPAEYVLIAAAIVVAIVALSVAIVGVSYLLSLALVCVTAPGVVVHEFAHKQACDLVGVPVVEVVYFRFGNPPGYVRHHQPRRYRTSFVISVAPFLVNTVVAFVAFLGFAWLVTTTGDGGSPAALLGDLSTASNQTLAFAALWGWWGLSVGMQAFPSTGDANTLWARSRAEWRRSPVVLLGVPVVLVIYLANLLSWLWADVFYALALGVAAFYVIGTLGF
ncbi:DUF3267 domain-containing protein [Natronorubrum sp. FCH18a]|uniref:DUF3267 domain-containing protein n=1 Tax=Natronorubrum sp. FCH18a TaxID=3447018 RepID=UPI003F517686